jgi:hypothetical protein
MDPDEPPALNHRRKGTTMPHHELPLPDYDNLPTGSLESRIRTLSEPEVKQLLDYEKEHANRIQVVRMLERRLVGLNTGQAAPSGGDPAAATPEVGGAPRHEPKASPQTEGPKQNPPSQGVPTNPAQPR